MRRAKDEVNLSQLVDEATSAIRQRWDVTPRVGVVLGSGLSGLSSEIDVHQTISYDDVPHFPCVTALGHKGRLLCGTLNGATVIVMDGRCHRYEGHSLVEITLPVRVMHQLGIELLVLSNASGGLHPRFCSGDVMLIEDHINLMWDSPLRGLARASQGQGRLAEAVNDPSSMESWFADGCDTYDKKWRSVAKQVARAGNVELHEGVYAAMLGPCYETRAEYRFLRKIGADVVGMSTVPEAIVAGSLRLPVLALSAVTNVCRPDCLDTTSGEAVVAAAATTESKMRIIVGGVLTQLASQPRDRRDN